jgi:hypothetical protein
MRLARVGHPYSAAECRVLRATGRPFKPGPGLFRDGYGASQAGHDFTAIQGRTRSSDAARSVIISCVAWLSVSAPPSSWRWQWRVAVMRTREATARGRRSAAPGSAARRASWEVVLVRQGIFVATSCGPRCRRIQSDLGAARFKVHRRPAGHILRTRGHCRRWSGRRTGRSTCGRSCPARRCRLSIGSRPARAGNCPIRGQSVGRNDVRRIQLNHARKARRTRRIRRSAQPYDRACRNWFRFAAT